MPGACHGVQRGRAPSSHPGRPRRRRSGRPDSATASVVDHADGTTG